MKKNNIVDTAQKGQTTTKDKTPIGKITLIKETEKRRKAREEQYRNFRINALKRRCERYGMNEEQIKELIEKLKTQLNAPKQYRILIMYNSKDAAMFKEALANANIAYLFWTDNYTYIDGDQTVLAKVREIAPESAKIHPYAKKMESVIPKNVSVKKKKPTNNTKARKTAAKAARKAINMMKVVSRKKNRGKSLAKKTLKIKHLAMKKQRKAKTIQMVHKAPSHIAKKARKAA